MNERARSDYVLVDGGGPNPRHVGACPDCGNYRADGRPPYLHHRGCPREGLQLDRYLAELRDGNLAGPTIWE